MRKLNLTRRSFLTAAAVTTTAASLYSSTSGVLTEGGESGAGAKVERIRSGCRGCGKMECGVWVTVKNGRAVKIEGDESAAQSMGNCCTKSMASMQAAYHPDRLKYPMKRTRPKGEDPGWVRVSWDEALHLTAKGLKEAKAKYGGESIFTMGGTSRVYCMASYFALKQLVQTPNGVLVYQVCKGPRHFGTQLTDEYAFSWMATVDRPSVYVQWAGAPEISNYDDSGRVTVDVMTKAKHFITVNPRMANAGKEADIWLPLRPGTDAAMALSWLDVIIKNKLYDELFVKRWTNGAFLFCADIEPTGFTTRGASFGGPFELKTRLLKESDLKEGGDPKKFMVWDNAKKGLTYLNAETCLWEGESFTPATKGTHVKGGFLPDMRPFEPHKDPAIFGEFEVTLKNGKKAKVVPVFQLLANRAAEYTPLKAEKITGVPAAQITKAAKTWATRIDPKMPNGGIQYALGVEQAGNSIQNVRALACLVGIAGAFDTPGGNRGGTRGPVNANPGSFAYAVGPLPPPVWSKILGGDRFPLLKWWTWWADAASVWDAAHTGKPYPVKAAINQSGDFMTMANATHAWEALKKMDFMVQLDLWHHPTAELADIILPVTHWLETNTARLSQGSSGGMGATVRCIKPLAEARPDVEVVIQMFKAMGIPFGPDPKNPWPNEEGELDITVSAMGMSWKQYVEKFQKDGWWDVKKVSPDVWGTYRRYEIGKLRLPPDSNTVYKDLKPVPGFNTPTSRQELWSTIIESFMPGRGFELPDHIEPPESYVRKPELQKDYPLFMITGRRIPVYFHSEHRQLPWCREQWPVPLVEINPATAAKYGIKQGDWVWIESARGKIREKADLYAGIAPGVINCEHQWWFPEMPSPEKGWRYSAVNQLVERHSQDPICGSSNLRGYPVKIYKADAPPEGIILSANDERLKKWKPDYKTERA